jgi:hypothetical protein
VARDTRLVQTAVIGDEQSDVPIVLPTEAIELDVFRRAHTHDTFWCGVLLGGCGVQLAHKLLPAAARQRLPANQWRLHGRAP